MKHEDFKYMGHEIKKTKSGYTCSLTGVTYRPNNGCPSWGARVVRSEKQIDLSASYSIAKLGFVTALEKAIIDMEKWMDLYNLGDEVTVADMKKVSSLILPASSKMCNRRAKKKYDKKVIITKEMVADATKEYLSNGGIIKQLGMPEIVLHSYGDESDSFLMGG